VTDELVQLYPYITITAARNINKGVLDVEENESWERLMIHAVPLVQYMGKGTEGLQMMREEFEVENEEVGIPTQEWWPANPCTIREGRKNRELAVQLVVFVVKGNKVAQRLVKKGIKAAAIWNRFETSTKVGPDSPYVLCCGWGHIEIKGTSMHTCGYCSGHYWPSDHACNMVRCTVTAGPLCGHTWVKCPNCKGNHIAFSNRCPKKTEAARAAW